MQRLSSVTLPMRPTMRLKRSSENKRFTIWKIIFIFCFRDRNYLVIDYNIETIISLSIEELIVELTQLKFKKESNKFAFKTTNLELLELGRSSQVHLKVKIYHWASLIKEKLSIHKIKESIECMRSFTLQKRINPGHQLIVQIKVSNKSLVQVVY